MSKRYVDSSSSNIRQQSNLQVSRNAYQELPGGDDEFQLRLVRITTVDYATGLVGVSLVINRQVEQYDQVPNALLPIDSYGINENGEVYGRYKNIPKGSLALIGYIAGMASRPIVLNIYPNNGDDLSNLASGYSKYDRGAEQRTVFPSQQTEIIKDNGEYIRTYNGQSFLQILNASDEPNSNVSKSVQENYDGVSEGLMEGLFAPLNNHAYDMSLEAPAMLLQHQSNVNWDKHRTKFLIKPSGEVLTKLYNNNYPERTITGILNINQEASLYRTYDSFKVADSVKNSGIKLTNDNTILLEATDRNPKGDPIKGSVEVTPEGTKIDGNLIASMESLNQLSKKLEEISKSASSLADMLNQIGTQFMLDLPQTIATHQGGIESAQREATTAKGIATQTQSDLKTTTEGLNTAISGVAKSVTDTQKNLNDTTTAIQKNIDSTNTALSNYKSSNNASVKNLTDAVASLQKTVSSLGTIQSDISKIQSNIKTINSDVSKAQSTANTANTNANNAIAGNTSNYWRVYNLVTQLNNSNPDWTFMVDDTAH